MRSIGDIEDILEALRYEDDEVTDKRAERDGVMDELVNKTIEDAYRRGASDIHIEPRPDKNNVIIRFRTGGVCQIYQRVPFTFKESLVARLKSMADMNISNKRKPQCGKILFKKYASSEH